MRQSKVPCDEEGALRSCQSLRRAAAQQHQDQYQAPVVAYLLVQAAGSEQRISELRRLFRSVVVMLYWVTLCPDGADHKLHGHRPCFLELKRSCERLPWFERTLEIREHQVVSTRLQLDRFSWLDLQPLAQGLHSSDTIHINCLVHLRV